jgi:hypothetical protein
LEDTDRCGGAERKEPLLFLEVCGEVNEVAIVVDVDGVQFKYLARPTTTRVNVEANFARPTEGHLHKLCVLVAQRTLALRRDGDANRVKANVQQWPAHSQKLVQLYVLGQQSRTLFARETIPIHLLILGLSK